MWCDSFPCIDFEVYIEVLDTFVTIDHTVAVEVAVVVVMVEAFRIGEEEH